MKEVKVESLCSLLQPFVLEVLKEKIGVCAGEVDLIEVASGRPTLEQSQKSCINDRFKLLIPLAGQYLSWEVVFNCCMPEFPPDFEVNDDAFLSTMTADTLQDLVPSMLNWDKTNNKSLLKVILELRSAYNKYQVDVLNSENSRCSYEYSSLLSEGKLNENDIEVLVTGGSVHFLIHLNVDFSQFKLPKGEENYVMALSVSFSSSGRMNAPDLVVSPCVAELITSQLQLPPYIKNEENLASYIPVVTQRIKEQLQLLISRRERKRKFFIIELLCRLGTSVISYDAINYLYANFLLDTNGFLCILMVKIPEEFPNQPPLYKLQSVYNSDGQEPLVHNLEGVPFSPQWSIKDVVDRSLKYIEGQKVPIFQTSVVKQFQLPS